MPRQNVSTSINKKNPIHHIPGPTKVPTDTRSSFFLDSMVSGFGVGIGSSLARKMFESKTTPVTVPTPDVNQLSLDDIFRKYEECLKRNEPTVICEDLLNP